MNDELRKETVMAYSRYYFKIFLEGLRKNMKDRCPGSGSEPSTSRIEV
jgi:hypothetical protein